MSVVSVTFEGDVAWVEVNNPPVNATSTRVRAGLLDAVDAVKSSDLAVLSCRGSTFIAGGDMREFDAQPQEPHLPDVVQAIEDSATPFLCLMHGRVLGGGLEIAMACAYRFAAPGTRFGLPEVNVGLVPGAGGAQRAPRLFSWEAAFHMAAEGKTISADTALSLGAIDAISDDLGSAAKAFAPRGFVKVSSRTAPRLDPEWLRATEAKILARAKGATAPSANIKALKWATEPYADGQPKERALHLQLRNSSESRALRHAFFAERAVGHPTLIKSISPHTLSKIAVVGGGLMGAGIAAACLSAGHHVAIIEQNDDAAHAAKKRTDALVSGALQRGKINQTQFDAQRASLSVHSDFEGAADADLAIEAVFEDVDVKKDVFAKVADIVAQGTILATNTSYLDPKEIFSGIPSRARCIGLHFFSPAHIMRLMEVIPLPETTPETVATGFRFAKSLGKIAVLSGICDGFIGNRMLATYRRAAEYMLADGALPHDIDAAMRSFGMAMGPFEAQDMSGLQIAQANRRRQDATRDPNERYVAISDQICADGRFGRRVGRGWYQYDADSTSPRIDPTVTAKIETYSAEHGIKRRNFSETDIQDQLLAALANEGARIVEEGIAQSDGDVDVVKMLGYGFPRWRGGPMHTANEMGATRIKDALDALAHASPKSWKRATRFT